MLNHIENRLHYRYGVVFMFQELRWDVIIRLVDSGGIVEHDFKLSFHNLR